MCMHASIYIYTHIYMHVDTYVYTHPHTHTHTQSHTHVYIYIYIYIYMYVYVYIYIYMNTVLAAHTVGGQEWVNIQDPLLWHALLNESVLIPGEDDKFAWRGLICHQPERDGANQLIESVVGEVFYICI